MTLELDQAELGVAVERGNVDRDGDPTGYGETLAGLALKVRGEVFGPSRRK